MNLTVSLSKALAGTGITVNTVSPGPVETETWRAFARGLAAGRDWGDDIEDIKAGLLADVLENPVGRIGRPEDVAGMVSYLASPRADYVNAVNIRVDGGLVSTVV